MTKNPYFPNLIRSMIVAFFIAFIAVSLGCSSTKTKESTGQFIDDAAITAKVKAKLFDDPVVRGTAISVETFKGTVQLSGFANSKEEANKAESLAKSVEGVRTVRNSIVLKQ